MLFTLGGCQAISNTDLVFSLPLRIAEHFVRLAPLKILPIPIDFPTYDLLMVWHSLRDKEPAHAWLRQEILDICGDIASRHPAARREQREGAREM